MEGVECSYPLFIRVFNHAVPLDLNWFFDVFFRCVSWKGAITGTLVSKALLVCDWIALMCYIIGQGYSDRLNVLVLNHGGGGMAGRPYKIDPLLPPKVSTP